MLSVPHRQITKHPTPILYSRFSSFLAAVFEKALHQRENNCFLTVNGPLFYTKRPAMSLRGDVCVVTGACGFLGKRLVRLLLEEEKMAEIRLLDKQIQLQYLQSLEGKPFFSTKHPLFQIKIHELI